MNPLNLFTDMKDAVSYEAGETIFKQGEPGDTLYVVRSGEVAISFDGEPLETVGVGSILGEMALIDRSARSATATAKNACQLIPVNEGRFRSLVSENPFFALHVMEVMADRLRKTNALATK